MYLTRVPRLIQRYYSGLTWRKESPDKVLYLTFDDGPTPEVTPWVLDELARWDAKATFFWLGKQVKQHPELAHRILDEKHSAGNHSFSHLNGWRTDSKRYLRDFLQGQRAIREYTGLSARLFRPPHGRITR
ncbi:MAG: polysaccharide deacetylase family protein, partial [Bacteroidetes bacterium]